MIKENDNCDIFFVKVLPTHMKQCNNNRFIHFLLHLSPVNFQWFNPGLYHNALQYHYKHWTNQVKTYIPSDISLLRNGEKHGLENKHSFLRIFYE